jgi:hypothetical protein
MLLHGLVFAVIARKIAVPKRKASCPICGEELVRLYHLGARNIVKEMGAVDYVGCFYDDMIDADGSADYCEVVSGSYMGGVWDG